MDKEELEKQMKQMNEKFERSFEAWRKKRNTAVKEVLNVLVDSDLTYEEAVKSLPMRERGLKYSRCCAH